MCCGCMRVFVSVADSGVRESVVEQDVGREVEHCQPMSHQEQPAEAIARLHLDAPQPRFGRVHSRAAQLLRIASP